jgi:predicted O-linked N-acetylglucosamine transferase (SPINDLY family)
MRGAFERAGLDFDRHVRLLPRVPMPEFRALLARTHVNLDTIGFSGCVSTFEISAANVPTVTLPLDVMRSRQSAAVLRRMELDELCARDADDYVRIALVLGRDPALREALAQRIDERKHRLFDDRGVVDAFAREIEAGLVARR